jgi:hypothetical protein
MTAEAPIQCVGIQPARLLLRGAPAVNPRRTTLKQALKTTTTTSERHAVLSVTDLETVTGGSASCCPTQKGAVDRCPPGDKCHSARG